MIRRHILAKFAVFIVAAGLALLSSTHAFALDPPKGAVILVVSGNVSQTNVGDEAHFDKAMLASLAQHETITRTPWHNGVMRFTGPLVRTILEAVDAEDGDIRVVALNEYSSTLPIGDLETYDVILAMQANDKALRIRDHGPLFVIYPFDQHPALLNEEIFTRSVWQVTRIEVE